jgi:hypothetical protein
VQSRKKNLDKYGLHEFIEVAQDLEVLAKMAILVKGFRNQIHPDRVARTQEQCTRTTAPQPFAAMEAGVELYSQRYSGTSFTDSPEPALTFRLLAALAVSSTRR